MKYSIEDSTLERIANSIRTKKGTTDKIKAEDFANEIGDIPAPVPPNLQDKSIEITENGTTSVSADEGYDGINNIEIKTTVEAKGGEPGEIVLNGELVPSNSSINNTLLLRQISKISFSPETGKNWTDFSYLVYNCPNLIEVDFKNLNTLKATSFNNLVTYCSKIENIDISKLNTSNVTSCRYMFSQCQSLKNVNFGNIDLSNVTDFSYAFSYLGIDVFSFSRISSKVNIIDYMFTSCTHLTNLDLSGCDSSNIVRLEGTFSGCTKLSNLNLSGFDTKKMRNLYNTFYRVNYSGNIPMEKLDLSSFTTESMTSLTQAFDGSKIKKIDIRNMEGTLVTDMGYAFNNNYYTEEIYMDKFDFSKVTSFSKIFYNCGTYTASKTTKIYVKDETARQWILNLSTSNRPSTWSTENIIIAGSAEDTRTDI